MSSTEGLNGSESTLAYPSGAEQLSRLIGKVVVIIGAGRSGKTLVGNLLGSCQRVEHIDQPWLLDTLPVLAGHGLIPESLAVQMFQAYTVELWYDRILMRNVNFRPEDRSSIWQQKGPQEILSRLVGLYSRGDVQRYVGEQSTALVLTMTDNLPFFPFFMKALPDCHLIHVLRDGLDVALEVADRRWFSDEEHLQPVHANPYRPYQTSGDGAKHYIPYWVEEGTEDRFLSSSEFARGLCYWRRLMEKTTSSAGMEKMRVVKLADVLDRPEETISQLIGSLAMEKTNLTGSLLGKIQREEPPKLPAASLNDFEIDELRKVRESYPVFGLPTDNIDALLAGVKS